MTEDQLRREIAQRGEIIALQQGAIDDCHAELHRRLKNNTATEMALAGNVILMSAWRHRTAGVGHTPPPTIA
jgi:hypothetical protein